MLVVFELSSGLDLGSKLEYFSIKIHKVLYGATCLKPSLKFWLMCIFLLRVTNVQFFVKNDLCDSNAIWMLTVH